ncbi:MAG: diaminopimelate decarboxylase [Candidatus Omnitrophota bacterium]|nr:MAG: diaminopimelate decarboxylase [Candidatus Omnitrophota bacterium]
MNRKFDANSRFFSYRDGQLYAESVNVAEIAESYRTPLYVYSKSDILDSFQSYKKGLQGIPHLIAFAVKANGNLSILNTLGKEGAGADLTSGGEMHLALRGGIPADRMVFSGVGKTRTEIIDALDVGILMFNVESEPELDAIESIAREKGKPAPIAVRVNPDIDAKTHPKITTGLKEHKFGVPIEHAYHLYRKAVASPYLKIQGIASHIGSSLQDTAPLLEAMQRLLNLKQRLLENGIPIAYVDLGGGLGIRYNRETPDLPETYARKLAERIRDDGATLIIEPGRSIVGNAGILLCRVVYVKRSAERTFVVVDAGMNDLARPAIYGAYHRIVPVHITTEKEEIVDVVGPICESSDVFGRQIPLPPCKSGDLLAICSAGAYGYAMSSHYNGRVRPAEALVEENHHWLVRKRETYEVLWQNQMMV